MQYIKQLEKLKDFQKTEFSGFTSKNLHQANIVQLIRTNEQSFVSAFLLVKAYLFLSLEKVWRLAAATNQIMSQTSSN